VWTYDIISLLCVLFQQVGMSKSKLLNIRIDPDLKKKAKTLAKSDGRSLSNWVTHLIHKAVETAEKKGKHEDK